MNPLHSVQKKLGIALFVSLLGVAVWYGILRLVYVEANDLAQMRGALSLEERQGESLQTLSRYMDETKEVRERIAGKFVDVEGVVIMLENVEAYAASVGVVLEVSSVGEETRPMADLPGGGKTKDTYRVISLAMDAFGTWDETQAFISILEHAPYEVIIERMRVERHSETGEWRVNIVAFIPAL